MIFRHYTPPRPPLSPNRDTCLGGASVRVQSPTASPDGIEQLMASDIQPAAGGGAEASRSADTVSRLAGRETFDEHSDDSWSVRQDEKSDKDEKSGEDSPVIVSILRATDRADQQQNERGQGGQETPHVRSKRGPHGELLRDIVREFITEELTSGQTTGSVTMKDLQQTLLDSSPQFTQQIQQIYKWCAAKKHKCSTKKLLQEHGFSFCGGETSNPSLLFVIP